ncbi:hypothetical protein PHLGIDRAFT_130667 [Phlebiopsis gigantea 11061_1 CR5-6]|uniref:DNA repair protein rhp7 treble clef domain-containing protein n=1 Tax=Phlebiopsis gigantea (strain 11061_1 CR5-6) TaxID=745531 RepID=A0A0C3NDG6_PHLG1|nr:hypothetical protein PHLGIDRAFT_130667 [Phlebiopsis gigantea 11061_1 CR5-6]
MVRANNNVRGPTSALTEFLRESGITPTTIAQRARTREVPQPIAGPSSAAGENGNENEADGEQPAGDREYNSDNLDESDAEKPAAKKRKMTKAAQAKLKAQAKAKKNKKKDDEDEDEDEDAYTALSKMWKDDTKPPNGSMTECAKCGTQFTVTQYTRAAQDGPGWLCHPCAKACGIDPFKKPAAPRKRKPATEKRTVTHFEERRLPSLASFCVTIISKHIDDIEALGDIGSMNMDRIAKAIAKDRSLTSENAALFYDVRNANLTLYDATNLIPPALCTLASLNPNLTTLRLDFCGRMDNTVLSAWSTALPRLKRLELLGPFLVHASTWCSFFESHPQLEGFLITQSPRFNLACMESLVAHCKGLTELRLKEIGQLDDTFLDHVAQLGTQLTYLDISYPGVRDALSDEALIALLAAVGAGLTHLALSGHAMLGDAFLFQGLKPHARALRSLELRDAPELTDAGALERLDVGGWRATPEAELARIGECAPRLRAVDIGWCREATDWTVRALLENCPALEEVRVWGCQRVTEQCPRKRNVAIFGIETKAV